MSTLLEAHGVNIGYRDSVVVRDLNLEIRPGEVVALLGANGAGKTTTLLGLAGELPLAAGQVIWNGRSTKAPLYRRARSGLAFITEERSIFFNLTARQNLVISRNCDVAMATVVFPELATIMNRRGGLLSGGEQQMLTLARALVRRTRLLLADELSLGLAPQTVGRLLHAIRASADNGMGALIVEQHVHRVLEIADRFYVMRHGRIVMSGTAAEAAERLDEIQEQYLAKTAKSPR